MKLEDIDKLNEYRKDWKMRRAQMTNVVGNPPNPIIFANMAINDADILHAVRAMVMPLIQKKMEEAKTRLMLLGVDEFPE